MELPRQKGFYDTKRQFQGHDSPEGSSSGSEAPDPAPPAGIPRGQAIAGLLLLALLAVAFFKLAIPEKIAPAPPPSTPAAPAAPAPAH